ncbi:FAD binding domain-containing protein [Actinoplanes sp. NPDC048796]|uniref:FAD binding domain-containing protein n=1 Tax=Actinoplanes sp. NPDC048796 TaxID=3155640 RepID=UPI00340FF982
MDYIPATSPAEVLATLADGQAQVLAGGQSLFFADPPRRVVDINRVAEFDVLTEVDGTLRVGPLVRHRTFETDAVAGPLGDLLRVVVRHIGHPPVRARGTMVGSLAYAHPAAEWTVVAMILDASLELSSPGGSRTVPAARFFTGAGTTARRPDELLSGVLLPQLPPGTGVGYAEDRRGPGIWAYAATMTAVTMVDDVVTAAAIGLVNAGPCPVRARDAERALIGTTFSDTAITAAANAAAAEVAGDDRRRAVHVLTRRALTQAREGSYQGSWLSAR